MVLDPAHRRMRSLLGHPCANLGDPGARAAIRRDRCYRIVIDSVDAWRQDADVPADCARLEIVFDPLVVPVLAIAVGQARGRNAMQRLGEHHMALLLADQSDRYRVFVEDAPFDPLCCCAVPTALLDRISEVCARHPRVCFSARPLLAAAVAFLPRGVRALREPPESPSGCIFATNRSALGLVTNANGFRLGGPWPRDRLDPANAFRCMRAAGEPEVDPERVWGVDFGSPGSTDTRVITCARWVRPPAVSMVPTWWKRITGGCQ